ncbi:SRPBCC family protein [Nocardia pseudovaccinii]|uniref:SRPBCC family protein n=1 Tax=Nocardia pseudovaccinii TaxID=189540 RepID=UPI0009FD8D80|nr:SRPBCC family protein [Nocardia pseudovaccinii]
MAAKTLRDTTAGVGKKAAASAGRATKAATGAASTIQKKTQQAAPTSPLQQSMQNLTATLAARAASGLSGTVSKTADRLNQYAEDGGGNLLSAITGVERLGAGASPLQAAMSAGMAKLKHSVRDNFETVKESITGGKGKGGGKKRKPTNIVEQLDLGVPIDLAYDQWTQFSDFPKFTKKIEQVEQESDEKLTWTGKVFWSRRTWKSTILEQVPYERIVWRSSGAKGYIDGAVSFHEITPGLTRILVVLEYQPHGLFEKTANMWRAAGRRCRLELKQFERHVMTEAVLHPDDIVGWHGEIRDSKVVKDDETARREEEEEENAEAETADNEDQEQQEPEDESEEEPEDESDEFDEDEQDEGKQPAPPRRRSGTKRRTTAARRSSKSGART